MTVISKELNVLSKLNKQSLEDPRLTIYNQDAFTFINQAGVLYDRVIIDMPDPHNEAINKLYSREFYTMIRKRMTEEGVLVSQSSSPFFTRNTYWCIQTTLESVFANTLSYHVNIPSFGDWGFNLARANRDLPDEFEFDVETKFLDENTMQSAMVFSKDVQKLDVPVNSIMEPRLYQLYLKDLQM